MPLGIAQIGRERSLSALARRVYRIEGPQAAELARRAEAALLEANPALGGRAGFKQGASVIVPAVPGADLAEATSAPGRDPAQLVAALDESLAALTKTALGAVAEEGKEAERTAKELDSQKLRQVIEKNAPALFKALPEIQANAKKRGAEAKQRQGELGIAFERAKKDLASLMKTRG